MTLDLTADQVLTTTRAVRKRLDYDRPVERELIEECLTIAVQAPTGSNRQDWQYVVIGDPETRAAIAEHYRVSFAAYASTPMPSRQSDDSSGAAAQQLSKVRSSAQYLADTMHLAPYLLIPVAKGRAERLKTTEHQAGFWGSAIPALWSFMLAARVRGLGTAWTTLHLTYEKEVAEIIGLPYDRYTQVALTPIAYTKGTDFKPAERDPVAAVTHWDRW